METNDADYTGSQIHVAIAFDKNYLHPFYALMSSIFYNHAPKQVKIHAIATGISDEEKDGIVLYVKQNNSVIQFYTFDESLVRDFVLLDMWTHAVYYRLLFPLLITDKINRLLYLDSDTLVIQNLNELCSINMESFPVAAVYDNYVKTQPLLGINTEGEYFNSGVLLIDIGKWKEQRITELAIEYLKCYPERIKFVDQCALNAVLKGNWKKLDGRFNLIYSRVPQSISKRQLRMFLQNKVIIHFTLERPWSMLCKNRLSFLYHYYLKKSSLGKQVKQYEDFDLRKIPAFLKIALINFYFDLPLMPQLWKQIKSSLELR